MKEIKMSMCVRACVRMCLIEKAQRRFDFQTDMDRRPDDRMCMRADRQK